MNNAPHGPGDTAGYIGRYALQELLGKGAMGEVYRAILHGPAGFQKTVALKVLLPSITTRNTDFRATLTNEARLGGLLKHPNVVETYELGEESDLLYIAMEYVAGLLCPESCVDGSQSQSKLWSILSHTFVKDLHTFMALTSTVNRSLGS